MIRKEQNILTVLTATFGGGLKMFAIILFAVAGWKLQGQMPVNITKCIVVGAPHTSNYDLFFVMAGLYKTKLPVRFLIKQEWLMLFPIKNFLLSTGALGINRAKINTTVDSLAELITTSNKNIAVLIAPEGTRKRAVKWKTGFYYAALKAKVPIILISLDYSKKLTVLGPNFMPSGCYKSDMQILKDFYKDVVPKYPDNFCLDIYLDNENETCAK